jgi:hypothetical protein
MEANTSVFYAMLVMFLWTFLVGLRNLQVRVGAVRRGELSNDYFELFRGPEPSAAIAQAGNHLRNLFEFPVTFYVVALAAIALGGADEWFVRFAWVYVILRLAHGIVHLTLNRVPVRFTFFFLSNLFLLVLWVRLAFYLA